MNVDLQGYTNRHSLRDRMMRMLWHLTWLLLFRPTPGFCHGWRIFLLRRFGATIGGNCAIYPSCRIRAPWNMELGNYVALAFDVDFYNVDKITIGSNVTISQYAFLCTASHDISDPTMELTTAPITIGDGAWVAAKAFVAPGVNIGQGAVVGACAVVCKDVASWAIVAGNPARVIRNRVMQGK